MPDLAQNKRARFDYEILDTIEAGIALLGHEVKAVRSGRAKLIGSFVHLRDGEAWLTNATIARYAKASGLEGYDPTRPRRLLLKRRELQRWIGKLQSEHLTIIPLRLSSRRGRIKVEVALARGKRAFEKRALIRKREDERRMRRARMRDA